MTWAETSSPAESDLHPHLPDADELLSAPALAESRPETSNLEAEIGAWEEPPVALADDAGLSAMGARAEALGYLWVELGAPGPEFRGRLGLYIEEGLEAKLEQLGAPSAGIHAQSSLDASLSDQLYRARFVERRGLALGIPTLEGIANLGRTLDADDSSVLRWWIAATADRPVRLVVSAKNQSLRVFPSPVLFDSLFELAPEPVSPRPPSVALAESAAAMELSDLPPMVAERAEHVEAALPPEPEPEMATRAEPTTDVLGTRVAPVLDVALPGLDRALGLLDEEPPVEAQLEDWVSRPEHPVALDEPVQSELELAPEVSREAVTIVPPAEEIPELTPVVAVDRSHIDVGEFLRVLEADSRPPPVASPAPSIEPELVPEPLPQAAAAAAADSVPTPLPQKRLRRPFLQMASDDVPSAEPEPSAPVLEAAAPELPLEQPVAPANPPALDPSDAFNQLAIKEWPNWRDALAQAGGPRPLAAIERMFVTDYTRLREATRRGIADQTASAVLDEWQASFQKSYAETFDALRVRGKRPTMVLDLPDVAQRLGRLQGARRVQLLLVDGLRFDLGLMVQERLRARVDAALTERLLLWSALPSITTYQLELLGKGPEGLLEPWAGEESPTLVARGRAARSPRRIRTGRVEVLKIDVVEDALRTIGRPVLERFDDIASQTADAVAEHMAAQPPRTLVVLFGDHGFRLDPARRGTTEEVRQGGSSPEEVLVPAFAWLTGAVH